MKDLFIHKNKPKKVKNDQVSSEGETFYSWGSSREEFMSDSQQDEMVDDEFCLFPRNREKGDFVIIFIEKKKYHYVAKILEKRNVESFDYYVSYWKLKSNIYNKFPNLLNHIQQGY